MENSISHRKKDYIFYELTRSICPECLQTVDAKVLIRDGKVILNKWCPSHGAFEALVASDAAYYIDAYKYNLPGRIPDNFTSKKARGCPWDCGLCPDHEQHTCVGLIDITDKCSLHCPTCFADSGGHSFLSLEQVEKMVDAFVHQEGDPSVLQLSGGEPTEHPDLIPILKRVTEKRVSYVTLNTNGLRLAQDFAFLEELAQFRERIEIYLQFDSLKPGPTAKLRGRDCLDLKLKAIENCRKFGIPMHLACTVKKGVNDSDLGELVRFGIETEYIRGINFQPAIWSGRFDEPLNPLERTTLTDVMAAIEAQTQGMFRRSDFVPLPCSHPTCISMTYAWIKGKKVKPIPRFVNVDRYLGFYANTIFMDPLPVYKQAIENLFSMSTVISSAKTLYDFSCVCGNPFRKAFLVKEKQRHLANNRLFRILIVQFEDKYTFDLKRVKKCCIGQILPDGRIVPFCSYNTLYRRSADVSRWTSPHESGERRL